MTNERYGIYILYGWLLAITVPSGPALAAEPGGPDQLALQTRARVAPDDGDHYRFVYETVAWKAKQTAVIVCDVWNKHWCRGASRRVAEMAPRMNAFLKTARRRGALIIHSPSGCMEAYDDHPARLRAQQAPKTELPDFLAHWNRGLDCEKEAEWPIDQAEGGCDCDRKCATGSPWTRQIDAIEINKADAISDSGIEIGNLLAERNIDNVIVLGVHTNMCVIGRPFGLRNMIRLGMNVVLVRDLTDTMYDPRQKPCVSHVRGTELIVEYIEKHICPTVTSSSLLDGPAFRFEEDERPHVALIVSDDHYHADKTLPVFAEELRREYGCYSTVIHGEGTNRFPAMAELETADAAVLFVRRLAPPKEQLDMFRTYLDAGGSLVALRTASHAFDTRGNRPEGHDEWRSFDPDVLGGNYQGHGPNSKGTDVANVAEMADHPILADIRPARWHSVGSLYYTTPIADDATLLMTGSLDDRVEPVTWIRKYGGARVFYTQLGHPDDFTKPQFHRLLVNAVFWALDRPVPGI